MTTWFVNSDARTWTCNKPDQAVAAFHQSLPNYSPTPLIELPTIAESLGVARVFLKDESARLNLSAFKILGASWAVAQALTNGASPRSLADVRAHLGTDSPTLVAATDGNHGRAVAHMARVLDLQCEIVVPQGISEQAIENIRAEGATVTVLDGSYDEAVNQAKLITSKLPYALHIQDMSWPGYEEIPTWIIDGYTTMCTEVDAQLAAIGSGPANLVAVPVGVGSFLHSVTAHYRSTGTAPSVLSVEPVSAACVLESLVNDELTSVGTAFTIMAGMNCGTPSSDSWPVLRAGVDAAIALTDDHARSAMRELAELGIDSGPCGSSTLSAVREALSTHERRESLGIGSDSIVVLLSTEGRAANPLA